MSEFRPPCRYCGAEEGFDQYGEVRVDAWRKVKLATRGENGKLTVEFERIESDGGSHFSAHDFDPTTFCCIACKREEPRLEDLIGEPVGFEVGAIVICPDGLRGTIATVDSEARTLTVEGWHETFKFGDVDLLKVAHVG